MFEYHSKRTKNWWFEWAALVKHEKALFSIELNIPTPKDKSVFFGITIFTCCLFFFEIAWLGPRKG
jgi:hypothetical protein